MDKKVLLDKKVSARSGPMLDREDIELLGGCVAIIVFAVALVLIQQ